MRSSWFLVGLVLCAGCQNSQTSRTDPFLFGRATVPPPPTGAGTPGAGAYAGTVPYGTAAPAGAAPYTPAPSYSATTPAYPYGTTAPTTTGYPAGMPGYGGVLPQVPAGTGLYSPPGGYPAAAPTYPQNPWASPAYPAGSYLPGAAPQTAPRSSTGQTPTIRADSRVSQTGGASADVTLVGGRAAADNPAANPLLPANYTIEVPAATRGPASAAAGWQQPRAATDIMSLPPVRTARAAN